MTYNIALLPGDGVGPEVTEATRRVLEATGVKFKWEMVDVGEPAIKKFGTPLPDSSLETIRRMKIALKGPGHHAGGDGFRSVNVSLRKSLGLYCCLRPCKTYPGVPSPYQNINITYCQREH